MNIGKHLLREHLKRAKDQDHQKKFNNTFLLETL